MKKKAKRISENDRKFADLILEGKSNTEAARACGYSEKSIHTAAYRILQKPEVSRYMEEEKIALQVARRREVEVDDVWITKKFKEILDRCMQAQAVMKRDEDGNLVQARDEDTGEPLFVFDSAGALRASENLAKHIGYYEQDNKQRATVIRVGIVQTNNIYLEEGEHTEDADAEVE